MLQNSYCYSTCRVLITQLQRLNCCHIEKNRIKEHNMYTRYVDARVSISSQPPPKRQHLSFFSCVERDPCVNPNWKRFLSLPFFRI